MLLFKTDFNWTHHNNIFEKKNLLLFFSLQIPTEYGVSCIGQGVPAELMRQHNFPLVFMGFVENYRSMITVDQRGFINKWRYHPKTLNSYSYFRVRVCVFAE